MSPHGAPWPQWAEDKKEIFVFWWGAAGQPRGELRLISFWYVQTPIEMTKNMMVAFRKSDVGTPTVFHSWFVLHFIDEYLYQ